jgi:type IV pilus assembly protein PilC
MSIFSYRAIHPSGKIHKGTLEASDETELELMLTELNLELISSIKQKSRRCRPTGSSTMQIEQLISFCQHIEHFLSVGVPLLEALTTIMESLPDGQIQKYATQIVQKLRSGQRVTLAFKTDPPMLDAVSLSLLEAGEASGKLDLAVHRISDHISEEEKIKNDFKKAIRYPLFLLSLALTVIGFMMTFVVPEIISFLLNLGQELPMITRILVSCAHGFALLWWTAPFVILTLTFVLILGRQLNPMVLIWSDKTVLSAPYIGNTLRLFLIARLMSSLSMLIESGMTVADALQASAPTAHNSHILQLLASAHKNLRTGIPLSTALHKLLSNYEIHMIRVAENSGTLVPTLDRIAKKTKQEANRLVTTFLGIIEPSLTLCVGSILAWVVLAVLGPIYGALGPLTQSGGMP